MVSLISNPWQYISDKCQFWYMLTSNIFRFLGGKVTPLKLMTIDQWPIMTVKSSFWEGVCQQYSLAGNASCRKYFCQEFYPTVKIFTWHKNPPSPFLWLSSPWLAVWRQPLQCDVNVVPLLTTDGVAADLAILDKIKAEHLNQLRFIQSPWQITLVPQNQNRNPRKLRPLQ